MKKIFRWAIILLGCLLVLLGIASCLAWYYKPEITQAIHKKLHEKINGEFELGSISISLLEDFPNVAITLEDIRLQGPQYPVYKQAFFDAKKVVLNVSLGKLLLKEVEMKSIKIVRGDLTIFRTRTGYTNLDVMKSPQATDTVRNSPQGKLFIDEVLFEDVKLSYRDSLKEKVFGALFVKGKTQIVQTDSSHQFHYTGKIDFERLQFNPARGSYLLDKSADVKLNVEYTRSRHELTIEPSALKFEKSTLELSGKFNLAPGGKFSLEIRSGNQNYTEGMSLLPSSLAQKLARYNVQSPFGIVVNVVGETAPGSMPWIDIQFTTKDAGVSVGKYRAQHASLAGSFTNHEHSEEIAGDRNSVVQISSFTGIYNGLPMKGQATFIDLENPFAQLHIAIDADARSVQHDLDSTHYEIGGGTFHLEVNYSGKLKEYLDPNKSRFDGKLDGRADLKKVKLSWVKHSLTAENVNASITFTEQRFLIENFSFLFNKSPVTVSGSVDGFVPFFSIPSKKGTVKLQVSTPNLNFTPATPRTLSKAPPQKKNHNKKMISDLIDQLYSKLEFELVLNIKQFQYKNFKASELTGIVTLGDNQLQAKPIKMKVAGGDVQLNLGLRDLQRQVNPFWAKGSVQQAAIREFFYSFYDFNQKTISYRNLSGKINVNVNVRGAIDDNLNVLMPRLRGNVDFRVRDGKLTNFAPLMKLSNFLFRNRDFTDVKFAEIKSNFTLRGTELSIGRMEVQSSVISLFIEGRYSLADSTDLSIQLPLSNLKSRDKTYTPKNVGVDTKVGPSVFLRARRDEKGNIGISYDPFRKFRKK